MNLELKNIEFSYPYTYLNTLNNLSWSIASGGLIFLYAPEGRGKTTLLKLITGLYSPSGGQILKDGTDFAAVPLKERDTAYTDRGMMFFPRRSVFYNLAYPLKVRGIKKDERKKLIEELVRGTSVEPLLGKKIKELGYSEKLEVLLLRLFAVKRDIILFDEILCDAGEAKSAAAEKIEKLAKENPDKIIVLASADAEDGNLFAAAQKFTMDCGKITEGVLIDERTTEQD